MKNVFVALLVTFVLPQNTGVIAGRVLNSDGSPAIGVRVVAVAGQPPAQEVFLRANPNTQTDSAGRFRLESLAPGRYYLATGTEAYSQVSTGPGTGGFLIRQLTSGPELVVASGATLEGELRLSNAPSSTTPMFNVRGRVVGPFANLVPGNQGVLRVYLAPVSAQRCYGPVVRTFTAVAPDGGFELRNMAPGNYVACLVVSGGDAGRMFLYPARIVVADRHITDLTFDVTQQTISVLGQQVPAQ